MQNYLNLFLFSRVTEEEKVIVVQITDIKGNIHFSSDVRYKKNAAFRKVDDSLYFDNIEMK